MGEIQEERGTVATIAFPLPEESGAFMLAADSGKLWTAIWNVHEEMKRFQKHGNPSKKTAEDLAAWVQESLADIVERHI